MPSVINIELSDELRSFEIYMKATFTETIPMITDEERAESILAQEMATEEGTVHLKTLVFSYIRATAKELPNARELEDLDVLIAFSEPLRGWKYSYVMRVPLRIYSRLY